jgi:hypothetical protein
MRLREVLVNLQAEFDQIQKMNAKEKMQKVNQQQNAKAKKVMTAKQMQDIKDAVAAEECGLVPKY